MKELMELSMGNSGAMNCIMGMLDTIRSAEKDKIMPKVKECNIKGTDLYVLWSDISGKNYSLMSHLCESVPNDLLIKASSKQDYSGRELLKDYIDSWGK